MDELLAKTDKLIVIDNDRWEINEDRGSELGKFCAMGRLCSHRSMNRSLIKTILGRMWGLSERSWGVEIKHSLRNFTFLVFSFKSTQDLNIILLKSPWFLNHVTLIFDRMTEIPTNWEKTLSRIHLSGQILSVPPMAITQKNLVRLAGLVGEVIEVQQADVAKISSKGYFTFKENCGNIGHEMRVCMDPIRRVETEIGNSSNGFGPWLKVEDKKDLMNIFGKGKNGLSSRKGSVKPSSESCETPISLNKTVGAGCDSGSFDGTPPRPIPAGTPNDVGTDIGSVSSPKISDSGTDELKKGAAKNRLVNLKRKGVWMDDSIGDFSSNLKSSIGPHSNSLSIFRADCSLASMDLHEVPIIYENNVILGEGKNKRRKSNATRLNNIGSAISGFVFANDGSVFKAQVSNVGHKENMPSGSRFHFEKAWADNDECMEIIKEVWSNKYSRQPCG
ncbi:hypothetical protein G4B88_006835 [Cannabis sativa]|uniref:DUF4283 domain-containing protein n=1 Tax=Cannabis sativa TaxID=3483 RepID=A0A7J6G3H5_CANSA|nr:hypothetical protein G4B88_006835 [Cannabis sativa]